MTSQFILNSDEMAGLSFVNGEIVIRTGNYFKKIDMNEALQRSIRFNELAQWQVSIEWGGIFMAQEQKRIHYPQEVK